MMTVQSIGDQARSFAMQSASNRIKTTLLTLSAELASGEVADLGARLGGNTQAISGIEARLAALAQFKSNAAEAASFAAGMQSALTSVHAAVEKLGQGLYVEPAAATPQQVAVRSSQAALTLQDVIGKLNGSSGQRFLFSGVSWDYAPLSSADDILANLVPLVEGYSTATDVAKAVSDWFDAPAGTGGFSDLAYHGGSGGQRMPIGENTTVTLTTTALSPSIRESLKGLATAALIDRGVLASAPQEARQLLQQTGRSLIDIGPALITEASKIGYAQEMISSAQTEGEAATATLQVARNALREADPMATAAAISESETKLQTLYTVIGRLSQMKLADYI